MNAGKGITRGRSPTAYHCATFIMPSVPALTLAPAALRGFDHRARLDILAHVEAPRDHLRVVQLRTVPRATR